MKSSKTKRSKKAQKQQEEEEEEDVEVVEDVQEEVQEETEVVPETKKVTVREYSKKCTLLKKELKRITRSINSKDHRQYFNSQHLSKDMFDDIHEGLDTFNSQYKLRAHTATRSQPFAYLKTEMIEFIN